MANVKQVMVPSVADFIERFAEKTWAAVAGDDCVGNPYWDGATHYFAGFRVAFEVVFGRPVREYEFDVLTLNLMEREHQYLLERGTDVSGFTYPAWWPGNAYLLKLRARLGKPDGAKNAREHDAMVDACRNAWIAARRAA